MIENNERKYDMIFLDLGMPIKDGYEACKLILAHYEMLNPALSIKDAQKDWNWLRDLKVVFNLHNLCQEANDKEKILVNFKKLYQNACFKVMDNMPRPFIFAYSAQIDEAVIKLIEDAGFDGYIDSKLGPESLSKVVHDHISSFVEKIIDEKLEDL